MTKYDVYFDKDDFKKDEPAERNVILKPHEVRNLRKKGFVLVVKP